MKKIKPYIFLLLFIFSLCIKAQSITDWEIARSENNVQISYRWVTSKNGKSAREMKTEFILDSNISSIVKQINIASNLAKWSKDISECVVEIQSPTQWNTYTQYDLPWPLKSKDLYTKSELIETEMYSIIKIESHPNSKPQYKNCNRIWSYTAEWKLIPITNNKTEVVLKTISYDAVKFPRSLTDPIIQSKMIESIRSLKKQLIL